ncbi:hypothetical protein V3W47_08260 [Deinococcus sp. YIM 134068]|uniref:hypothetical protein n=1 Tax=Deinococcus lichenicola TaxID=3118910 RepID=UPI002F94D0CD
MISPSAPAGVPVYSPICCPNCGRPHVDLTHRQDPELLGCTCCGLVDDLLQFRPAHLLGRPTPATHVQGSRLRALGAQVQEEV